MTRRSVRGSRRRWSSRCGTKRSTHSDGSLNCTPDDAGLRFEQATMLMQLRHWVDAIDVLKGVLDLEPEHARAWFDLAVAHQSLRHLAEARAAWDRGDRPLAER